MGTPMMRERPSVLLLFAVWMIAPESPASAQLGTATISGNVTDSTGAVVVG